MTEEQKTEGRGNTGGQYWTTLKKRLIEKEEIDIKRKRRGRGERNKKGQKIN